MITIISGTNYQNSNTSKVALEYKRFLKSKGIKANILALDEIDITDMLVRGIKFLKIENDILRITQQFVIIIPEYNGSYPGILKLMIDSTEVEKVWHNKKVLLTGIASGRGGNLRGMEHLTGSLLHMKVTVHPNRLPLSVIHKLLDKEGRINDTETLKAINIQLDEFINWQL